MKQVKFNLTIDYEVNELIAILKMLKGKEVNVTADDNYAIKIASTDGHAELVELLIEAGADVTADYNYAIIKAAENNHIGTLKVIVNAM